MEELPQLNARPLSGGCGIAAFKCGEGVIDKWLSKHAQTKHDGFRSRVTTFCTDQHQLVGFYSLKLILEEEKDLRSTFDVRPWTWGRQFPALQVEFIAVCEQFQGRGLGRFMMAEVLDIFCRMAETTALPVAVLQPLNSELAEFYGRRKFVPYGRNGSMMLDARTAITARNEEIAKAKAAEEAEAAMAAG